MNFDTESFTVNGHLNNNNIVVSSSNSSSSSSSSSTSSTSSTSSRKSSASPNMSPSQHTNCVNGVVGASNGANVSGRRKRPCLSARERNVRRIESNERERLRMHGLNEAFQVGYKSEK